MQPNHNNIYNTQLQLQFMKQYRILKDGELEDYDTPLNLLNDHKSYLYKRISEHGKTFENKFSCSCEYFQNENKICFHLISLLNEIGIRCNLFSETWNSEENILSECMSDL